MAEIHTPLGTLWAAVGPEQPGKPTVVLIHGAGGSRLDWPAALRQLPNARVVAYDLAGHGRSAAPVRATVAEHAADLIALLDALALPAAILAGHSLGGAVALQAALTAPDRAAGLVLISTAARLRVSPAILEAANDPPALARLLCGLFWGPETPDVIRDLGERKVAEVPAAVLRADFSAAAGHDVRESLASITAPALVLCGEADQMTPPALSEKLRDALPHAEAVLFPGAGHRLPDERPQAVADAISGWLGRLNRGRQASIRTGFPRQASG